MAALDVTEAFERQRTADIGRRIAWGALDGAIVIFERRVGVAVLDQDLAEPVEAAPLPGDEPSLPQLVQQALDVRDMVAARESGIVRGFTTNPTLMRKSGITPMAVIKSAFETYRRKMNTEPEVATWR